MSDTVIKVANLSKKYLIHHQQKERYVALRDVIANEAKNMFNRGIVQPLKRLANSTIQSASNSPISQFNNSTEEFYALRDVSFEVKRGDRVGIIGRNGAGKSTLLKILSRITEPTTGRIEIKGRVASLLEVGTGFHPELTGRENIFLNGAILGMTKAEIKRKFDEIVDFAEIEKFLDTPVKHFSSGMYVRLAFAVAAHLEPEILIVDEVLAVGDAQFQKKCLGKMEEVSASGKTILFVSHNMGAISNLCKKGIYLRDGRSEYFGEIQHCVSKYIADWSGSNNKIVNLESLQKSRSSYKNALFKKIEMISDATLNNWQIPFSENPIFKISIDILRKMPTIELGIALYNSNFVEIASSLSSDSLRVGAIAPGEYEITAEFKELNLMPGTYALGLGLKSDSDLIMEDYIREAVYFEVITSEKSVNLRTCVRGGAILPKVDYSIQMVNAIRNCDVNM